ncbi:MAG: 30S ribosomal protein S9 [Candidatus Omnitrophica bacterium]|nr:30S ribosomal protein S9 [Candidatus Omnitrophota bacterium]
MVKSDKDLFMATGRRKTSIARVRVNTSGKGNIRVNGRELGGYFFTVDQRTQVTKVMTVVDLEGKVDVAANVCGGGLSGQAGAVSLGVARCLVEWNPEFRAVFRKEGLLTRDPRAKERKKYGRKGARKRFQWTKR